jgi:hypothetical protein
MVVEIVDEISRELAALVAVVSLAMIGISVRLLPRCWDRFQQYFQALSPSAKKSALPLLAFSHLPIVWAVISVCLTVTFHALLPDITILVVIVTALLVFLIEIGAGIKRRIKKQTVVKIGKMEFYAPYYFTALSHMTLSVFFNIGALIGVSPAMLLIDIGPVGPENYEWGKWFLYIGIFAFCVGIIIFGLTLALDKVKQRTDRDQEKNQS